MDCKQVNINVFRFRRSQPSVPHGANFCRLFHVLFYCSAMTLIGVLVVSGKFLTPVGMIVLNCFCCGTMPVSLFVDYFQKNIVCIV